MTQIINATSQMLDAMGLYQHHDAVTGTDAEFVAKDYSFQLSKAQGVNNKQYGALVASEIERLTGFKPSEPLRICKNSNNDTILDCPINDKEN